MKSKKSSNSLLFPVTKKKSCFNFQFPSSRSTDFNNSILPVPVLNDLKATVLPAACRVRSDATLAHCPVLVLVPLLVQGGMLELLCLIYVDTIFLLMVACLRYQLTIILLVWALERSLEHRSRHSVGTLEWQVLVAQSLIFLR